MKCKIVNCYDKKLDVGSVALTGEQARALVVAVADSFEAGGRDEIMTARMVAAVEALNHVFQLGIEEVDA